MMNKMPKMYVLNLLRKYFNKNIDNLHNIGSGDNSHAYLCLIGNNKFVARFNTYRRGYDKDLYAYKNFSSDRLSIPEILLICQIHDQLFLCVSAHADGEFVSRVQDSGRYLIQIWDTLRQIRVGEQKFGPWDSAGNATDASWQSYLRHTSKLFSDIPDFLKNIINTDAYNRSFPALLNYYEEMLSYCPERKYLVHGDFGSNNTLLDGSKVTAVLDWENSMYGDTLYDVAWASFWHRSQNYDQQFFDYLDFQGFELENYWERLRCYKIHCGLGSMKFYCSSNQIQKFWSTAKLLRDSVPDNVFPLSIPG